MLCFPSMLIMAAQNAGIPVLRTITVAELLEMGFKG